MDLVIPIRQSILPKQAMIKPHEEKQDHDEETGSILYRLMVLLGITMSMTKHQRIGGSIGRLDRIEKILESITEELNEKLKKLGELANLPEGETIDRILLAKLQEDYKHITSEISKRNSEVLKLGEIDIKGIQKAIEAATHIAAGINRIVLAAIRVANGSLK